MFNRGSEEEKVRKIYKKLAPLIIKDAAKYGIILDYSVDSLVKVDSILDSLHKEYKSKGRKITLEEDRSYQGYAQMLGSYMLAVVDKNNVKGKLTIVNDEYGFAAGFTFASGAFCDFVTWCQKAIINGREDAVLPKFEYFSKVS